MLVFSRFGSVRRGAEGEMMYRCGRVCAPLLAPGISSLPSPPISSPTSSPLTGTGRASHHQLGRVTGLRDTRSYSGHLIHFWFSIDKTVAVTNADELNNYKYDILSPKDLDGFGMFIILGTYS